MWKASLNSNQPTKPRSLPLPSARSNSYFSSSYFKIYSVPFPTSNLKLFPFSFAKSNKFTNTMKSLYFCFTRCCLSPKVDLRLVVVVISMLLTPSITLNASSGTVWWRSVRPSIPSFLTLIERAAHTQRDLTRGQNATWPACIYVRVLWGRVPTCSQKYDLSRDSL